MTSPNLTVIIPSGDEPFLRRTILDVLEKAELPIEVYAVLDGWWPEEDQYVLDPRVHYLHWTSPYPDGRPPARGQRAAYNAGAARSRAEHLMFLDAHCMFSQGYDRILTETCQEDWICVPTRKRLDAENWTYETGKRPDINYLRLDPTNDGMNFVLWDEKNKDRSLDTVLVDDILSFQGSCYFMHKAYYEFLGLFDEDNYGTFRKDPQEASFKAWTSGGRVVRVKGDGKRECWYAHLHKGQRYARGYHVDKADWAKGDEYVKRWYNDTAWDERQTRSWAWLMSKFSDMPGWKERLDEQAEKRPEVAVPPEPVIQIPPQRDLPRTYQVLKMPDGEYFTQPHPKREQSKFWNEGRWHNFIEPLLPTSPQDMTFVEMGANVGLYLKMATDYGFDRVVGVEKNSSNVKIGNAWRDALYEDWQLRQGKLGGGWGEPGNFNLDDLPVADVTLMACWHYYVPLYAWLPYLDRLAGKTCNVIVVSRPQMDNDHWLAQADGDSLEGYFEGWYYNGEEVLDVSQVGDSSPRALYSVCYISPHLHRAAIADIKVGNDQLAAEKVDLASRIASRETFDPMQTPYAEAWRERKAGEWNERKVRKFVLGKVAVMTSVRDNGLREPIIVHSDTMKLADGGHRLAMLKALGHTSAIVRPI